MALITLGLFVAAAIGIVLNQRVGMRAAFAAIVVGMSVIAWWSYARDRQVDLRRFSPRPFAGAAALVATLLATRFTGPAAAAVPEMYVISTTLAAAVLGGTSAAMLLGHAYLTHTAMPIDPLMRLTRLLALAVVLRAGWCGVMLGLNWSKLESETRDPLWMWMMLSVRVGVGLLGLAALTYMVWDCVKRRSTQSATGILYIAMIFAYFGELASLELARTYSLWV